MNSQQLSKIRLPEKPGVYFFKKGDSILYIGKATSLRDRTKSYFSKDLIVTRGPMILDMVVQADGVSWQETDSVLEALILEASLIKKHQPKYNIKEKDDKSWNYVCITNEEIPKIVIMRGRNILKEISDKKYKITYGPFPNGLQLRDAMKIIRRIFPYMDADSVKKDNVEFYKQLGLTPNGLEEYKKNIENLKLFFQGKKKKIVQNLKKDMTIYAKALNFEKANEIKKKIFALNHINDIALIKDSDSSVVGDKDSMFRIEAYDIAHMSGKNMVGVMTVVENGKVAKNEYKKFIIRTQTGSNDTGALNEVLLRRLRHTEWGMPDLIVVDGSMAQLNVAKRALLQFRLKIEVVGVVKDDRHKAKAIIGTDATVSKYKKLILLANSEAHRFAIKFYREKSRKNMFE